MKKNLSKLLLTILALSATVYAEENKEKTWNVFGYGRTGIRGSRNNNWNSFKDEFHTDNFTGRLGNEGESNYLELGGTKFWKLEDGSTAKVTARVEYGNNYMFLESSQPDGDDDSTQFELKELYGELGNLSFLPKDYTLWAGRRYYRRSAGFLSDDFFVQSSGVGAGIEGPKWAAALVGVDANGTSEETKPDANGDNKNTVYALDLRYTGIDKWEFQGNIYADGEDSKPEGKDANLGYALRTTYNFDNYYTFGKGFSSATIIYGQGLAGGAAGTNFGEWVPSDISSKARMVRLNTLGVIDFNDKLSLGSELNLLLGNKENPWAPDGYKTGLILRPQYRVNNNFKLIVEGSFTERDFDTNWGGWEKYSALSMTVAPTFTIDSGFWGRPEIRTFLTGIRDVSGHKKAVSGKKSDIIAGVQLEFWF